MGLGWLVLDVDPANASGHGRFQVRTGIHLGEVIDSDRDVQGDGVNNASRIQSEVAPGEIGFSSVVYDTSTTRLARRGHPWRAKAEECGERDTPLHPGARRLSDVASGGWEACQR